MNRLTIFGRLTKDPELRALEGKEQITHVCNFTVAVNNYGDGTSFFNCSIFGKRAQVIEKFFKKGSRIIVSGRMEQQAYMKDDEKRTAWGVKVDDFSFIDTKKESAASEPAGEAEFVAELEKDDDLPF
jgi:single-strand DNA-binding protein